MTRVSLTTSASRGGQKIRQIAHVRIRQSAVGADNQHPRAVPRIAGESAMLSGGRTKSKASTRIAVIAIL